MTVAEILNQVRELQEQFAQEITAIDVEITLKVDDSRREIGALEAKLETLEEVEELLMSQVMLIPSSPPNASVAATGTLLVEEIDQGFIIDGGKTIILTLTADTWVASGATFNAQRQDIIDNIVSDQSETNGWNEERPNLNVTDVVRTSPTVVTITLSALASLAISAVATLTIKAPGTALTGAVTLTAPQTATITFGTFVATDGNDSTGDGTFSAPYLTIQKARDEIALANNLSPISMRGGDYHAPSLISFDSGDNNLTIQNYLSEAPVIYGGAAITSLSDGGNEWTKATDEIFTLLLDGVEQPRSALPVFNPADPYEGGWFTMDTGTASDKIVYEVGDIDSELTDLTNLKVYFYGSFQFWGGMKTVSAINHGTREITITGASAGSIGAIEPGLRYRLLDVKPQGTGKVLQPGEWWHSGTVLTYREVDSGFDGTGLVGGETKHIFDNSWASGTPATGLTFDGLTFRGSAPWDNHTDIGAWLDDSPGDGQGYRQAVRGKGDNFTVKNCKFEYCGGGVALSSAAFAVIFNNEFKFIGHASLTLTDGSNNALIDNNLFEDGPHLYRAYQTVYEVSAFVGDKLASVDAIVKHNRFNRIGGRCISWGTASTGRKFGGGWLVELNKCVDVCLEVEDAGAIYVINRFMEDQSLTTTIQNNHVENALGRRTDSSGNFVRWSSSLGPHIYGLYLDDGASKNVVTGNIVIGDSVNGMWGGYIVHGGFENVCTGNIFLNCLIGCSDRGNSGDWAGTDENTFNGNIISRRVGADDGGSPVDGRFIQVSENPPIHTIWNGDNNNWYGANIASNFAWDQSTGAMSKTTWEGLGTPHDENSITTDPLFTDPANGDYTLQVGSPAKSSPVNFVDLLFDQMGRKP